jgi:hypothetical protein
MFLFVDLGFTFAKSEPPMHLGTCSTMAALLQRQLHHQLVEKLPLLLFYACPALLHKEPTTCQEATVASV